MSKHAKFSPSAASRWLACPASVALTETIHPTDDTNVYSASGSVIHAIAEQVIRAVLINNEDHQGILDHAKKATWGYYCKSLPEEYKVMPVTIEMLSQVGTYLDCVSDLLGKEDIIGIESRLKYNDDLFGTADLVLINDEVLTICDLKTGSGHLVSPEENPQMMTYAGMALKTLPHPVKEVRLVIVQPPDYNVMKTWVTTQDVIESHMVAVEQAMRSDHIEAGEHCKYCPARASCPEIHGMATNAQSLNLDGLSPSQWEDTLQMAAILKPWCDSVAERAHRLAAEEGLNVPGYKLVQKYGRKTWASEKEAAYRIHEVLGEEDDFSGNIYNPLKLRTPTQLKKELKDFIDKDVIESLTNVPVRGTLLVPLKDKRPAIDTGENLLDAVEQLALFS